MEHRRIDALILTGKSSFEYFTGYRSEFWVSNTRPLYAVIAQDKDSPIIVVHQSEQRSAVLDPANNTFVFYKLFLEDSLKSLRTEIAGISPNLKKIAIDYGPDLFGRGSLEIGSMLNELPSRPSIVEGAEVIWSVRSVKSEYEIEMKRRACSIATRSFFEVLPNLKIGDREAELARAIKIRMFANGADHIDFLPVRFGKTEIPYLRPASDKKLEPDDFVWVDMGCVFNGYHSDLNRIAKAGVVSQAEETAYQFVRGLTIELARLIRPGMPCSAVIPEFRRLWSSEFGAPFSGAARIGHGSGIDLTEPPSIMEGSMEVIQAGMILHLEPKMETKNGVFQVEEVFVVRESHVEFLSDLSPSSLPSLA